MPCVVLCHFQLALPYLLRFCVDICSIVRGAELLLTLAVSVEPLSCLSHVPSTLFSFDLATVVCHLCGSLLTHHLSNIPNLEHSSLLEHLYASGLNGPNVAVPLTLTTTSLISVCTRGRIQTAACGAASSCMFVVASFHTGSVTCGSLSGR